MLANPRALIVLQLFHTFNLFKLSIKKTITVRTTIFLYTGHNSGEIIGMQPHGGTLSVSCAAAKHT